METKTIPFAKVTREALENKNISSDALRLLILMTNNAESWNLNTTYYQRLLGWNNTKLAKKTSELIALGYLIKNKIAKKDNAYKFEYEYTFPTSPFPQVVFAKVRKGELNKNNPDTAQHIETPPAKLTEVELLHFIQRVEKERIEKERNKQAVQLQEEHHSSKEEKIEKLDSAGSFAEKQVERVEEPISTDLKANTDIQEVNNPGTLSTEEVLPDEAKFDNWTPKQQLVESSPVQIDLDGLNGKEELTLEEKQQIFNYLKTAFKKRVGEFSSEAVMQTSLFAFATKLNENNFKSGYKTIARWSSFISASLNGIINDLNKKEIERVQVKEASQMRTFKILGLLDINGEIKETGTKYGSR